MSSSATPVVPPETPLQAPPDTGAVDAAVDAIRARRAAPPAETVEEKPAEETPVEEPSAEETPGTGKEPEPEPEPKPEAKASPEPEKPKRGTMQARLNTEIVKTAKERERAEKAERELAELKARPAPVVEPVKEQPKVESKADPKPTADDIGTKYKDWDEYNEAMVDWRVTDGIQKARKADEKRAAEAEAERQRVAREKEDTAARERQDVWLKERIGVCSADIEAFSPTVKDFDAVMAKAQADGITLTSVVHSTILELESGHGAVYYHLASNPAESKRIAGLTPAKQAKAILDLADRLTADSDSDETEDETGAASERGSVHRPSMEPIKPVGARSLSTASPLSGETNHDRAVERIRAQRAASTRLRRGSRG